MRTASGVLLSTAAGVALLAFMPARAAAPVTIEKSLLGIRILQTYKDVLMKMGQPRLIVRGGERFLYEPALDSGGKDLGGVRSISYDGGGSSTGGGGAPGGAGGPGTGGPPMLGPGGPGGPGMMSKGGGGSGPSMPGGGGGAGGGSDVDTTFGQAGGYAWFYHNARQQVAFSFLFNLEGRVLGIMERGREGGFATQRGLKLGSKVKDLYEIYGWPDTIEEIEPGFVLDYGTKYHAKFAVIKDKVVGIGVVLEESQHVPFFPEGGSNGGGGASGGGAPGSGGGKSGVGGFAPKNPGGMGGASSRAD